MYTRIQALLNNAYLTYPLYPFSLIYGGAVRLWLFTYKIGIKKAQVLGVPVISVGNIVAGGTGKTGCVIYLTSLLRKMGKRVCVLTRGYGGRVSGIVAPSVNPLDWGDEALLLRKHLPKTPILTGKDRVRTGLDAIEKFNPDLLILDDGFQYLRLSRDLNILLVDAANPWGGRNFPPCGLLREPLSSISRADIIMMTRVDQANGLDPLRAKLNRLNPEASILTAMYKPLWLEHHITKERMKLESLEGLRIVVFSGIGNPVSFERKLETLGAVIVKSFRFLDHHIYSAKELGHLLKQYNCCPLIATEKDGVKLPGDFPCLILKVKMVIVEGEELIEQSIRSILE